MRIGERIKKLREAINISQADLAKNIGVSAGNVGDWERKGQTWFDALLALSRFFDKPVDYTTEKSLHVQVLILKKLHWHKI